MSGSGMIPYGGANTTPEFYRAHVAPLVHAPPPQAPSLWDVYRKLKEPEVSTPTQVAVKGLRHSGESAIVGALLGFAHGEFGTLDLQGKYPIDGIAAVLLYAMSVRDAGKPESLSSDFAAASQACTTTLLYRKTREWREKSKNETAASRNEPPIAARSSSPDPIAEAGRRLININKKERTT